MALAAMLRALFAWPRVEVLAPSLVCLALLISALAFWRPAECRWAFRFAGRVLEFTWLYAPLVPLLGLAVVADRLAVQVAGRSSSACTWRDQWWDLFLRKAQRGGPVFVKLGQWAATRPDLLPEEWCAALGRLHDSTEPHTLAYTNKVMEEAFPSTRQEGPWYKRLLIEPVPVGSGCIAQVYIGHLLLDEARPPGQPSSAAQPLQVRCPSASSTARCTSGLWQICKPLCMRGGGLEATLSRKVVRRGVKVAVKVVHPQVRRAVEIDLKVLHLAAGVCDRIGLDHLGFSLMLRQFADFLKAQTDLRQEARNLRGFRDRLGPGSAGDGPVVVPEVFERWVSHDVLVMSFEAGEPLSDLLEADPNKFRHEQRMAWRIIVDLFWAMVFKHRFVHGDMHPGNLFWRRGQGGGVQMVLLDCGLVIDLGGQAGEDLSMMVKAFLTRPEEEVAALLIQLSERVGGKLEDVVDADGFIRGIADLIKTGMGVKFRLSKLNAGALMGRSLLLGRRHRVRFDARFVNLMVAMVVLQGVAMRLYGDGDIVSRMMPYVLGAAVTGLKGKRHQAIENEDEA